jgi:HK97 family phage major capsid protein
MKMDPKKLQESLRRKLENGQQLSEAEIRMLELNEQEQQLMEDFKKMMEGELVENTVKLSEFLATPSAQVLIPRVVIGTMREAAEPLYIGTKMLTKIRLKSGQSMIFPSIGPMRAHDVAEGQEIPQETIDWQTHETPEIRVGKVGLRLQFTEEMVSDSQWDIIAMMIKQAGRAMARHKEQKCFNQFRKHGHTVFDNALRATTPEAGTTGLDANGNYNDTFSAEDFLDLIIAVMANEYTPTDILMHPLVWTVFAKNELTGSLLASPYTNYPVKGQPTTLKLGPDSIQGRIPFSFNVQLSPFIPLDKKNRRFDLYCVDRNNIGVLLVKDDIKTDEFNDPSRDIRNIKMIERYGIGILNEGKAIAVAKNISMDKSYPDTPVYKVRSV